MIHRLLSTVAAGLVASGVALAQAPTSAGALPRRAWFGVALAPHESGAIVTAVVPASSAEAEGLRAGDIIRAVDDSVPQSPDDVVAAVARHAAGETAAIDVVRDGMRYRHFVRLRSLPEETLPGVTFEYGAVSLSDGNRLRAIVTVPSTREGRVPAVLLLQGGSCASVDTPMAADGGQSGLVRTIAAQGFATMRVDKSGVGDSQGPPCGTIGYAEEVDGFRAALAALRQHPAVDPERVFLLGISLGGVFAPVLASENPVRGIVVYGTLAAPPPVYPGRSERFFREFAAVDVAGAWSRVNARVLVLHGAFDESTREADHAQIAAIVNSRHPGAAIHRELAGLDHGWARHDTLDQSRANAGRGEVVSTLSDTIVTFLRMGS